MAALNTVLVGFGNPLLDISANVPQEFLDKYEVKLNNAILAEEKHKGIYDDMAKHFEVQYIAGGATQNSIRVCQWMLNEPNACHFVGCVGKDEFGDILHNAAASDGVTVHYLRDAETPTGTCAVLIHDAERSMVAQIAAAEKYSENHLKSPEIWNEVIEKARVFYIAAFFLTHSTNVAVTVGKHAADTNKVFALNLAAPFLAQFFGAQLASVLPYTDFVFCNESEAITFAECQGWQTKDPVAIAGLIANLPKANEKRSRTVVVTQGPNPTIVAQKWGGYGMKTTLYDVEPLKKEQLVDTNGAGDAFVGGFLSRLVQDKDIDECVHAGQYASRVVIQRSGCTFPSSNEYQPIA
eukprot:GILK01000937.1.p2 GENE.GILK01000937.1~~GILK01000937.1.p2  ORF type:complete len:352 (+),score=78.04 GILK01000937.1:648-1703(+)